MSNPQLRIPIGREDDRPGFRSSQFNFLAYPNPLNLGVDDARVRMGNSIVRIDGYGKSCSRAPRFSRRVHEWMAQSKSATRREVDVFPPPHVFVRRSWVPINPRHR